MYVEQIHARKIVKIDTVKHYSPKEPPKRLEERARKIYLSREKECGAEINKDA